MDTPTREIFGNIDPWMRVLFYALMCASMGMLAWRVGARARLWRKGQAGDHERSWQVQFLRVVVYALGQKRVHRRTLGALLHALLFTGFVILTIGTTLVFICHAGPVNFHHGWYYLFYELTLDVFGFLFCIGCLLAMYRRGAIRPGSLGHRWSDWLLLGQLLALGVTGFVLEALRLRYAGVEENVARWSIVGYGISRVFLDGVDPGQARLWHLGTWWLHAVLVAWFFVSIPVTRFLHVLTGPANIAVRPSRGPGVMRPVPVEEVEATGRIGVAAVEHFFRHQLLSLDACMECGRCEDACPAHASGKPLSPKRIVTDLRDLMASGNGRALHDETIKAETLWSCTMCQACMMACPTLIDQAGLIGDMRRNLVGEGRLSGPPATALRHLAGQSNPYGLPAGDRMQWAEGLDVPTVDSNPGFEYLVWIGCAASFDRRAQKVARATVRLLREAEVNFAVLGNRERCTGDPARRLGDEFLFQEAAQANIATLDGCGAQKIVSPCPHCVHTLKHEYAQFGGRYEVQHHSQFLAELMALGRLDAGKDLAAGPVPVSITLHDPCYLARVCGETEATRALLEDRGNAKGALREMPRHGGETFCCGAGGGRAWMEEEPSRRVSRLRAREAVATKAEMLATACPFCLNMMTDGVGGIEGGGDMEVLDVAEILERRRGGSGR